MLTNQIVIKPKKFHMTQYSKVKELGNGQMGENALDVKRD